MVREGSAGEQAEQNALGARAATAEKGGGTPQGSLTTTGRRAILLQDNRVLLHLAEKRLMEKEAQPHLHTKATRSGQMGGERVSELHEGVGGETLHWGSHGRGWRCEKREGGGFRQIARDTDVRALNPLAPPERTCM